VERDKKKFEKMRKRTVLRQAQDKLIADSPASKCGVNLQRRGKRQKEF
jgi:hypothetical protein